MARKKSGQRTAKATAKLIAYAESFGEFASICFAGGRNGEKA